MFDVEKIRNDFPMFRNNPNLVYFDSAATSFKPQCVIDKVVEYYSYKNTNIHRGDYDLSFSVSKEYDETRDAVAKLLNIKDRKCVVFTSGASGSLNLVAYGYGQKFLKQGDVILTTEAEHASNILPWFKVAETTKAKIEYIPLNNDATFNMDNFIKCFENNNVKVVSITQVSNVMGYIYPIKEICKVAHEHGAIVNVDGAQSVPHIKVDVTDLDVDFISFSSHKMCGPAGVGVLYGKYELLEKMDAFMLGGGSNARFDTCGNILLKNPPEKFEAGTPCVEGVLGLKTAIDYLENIGIKNVEDYGRQLTKYFIESLSKLDNVEIYNKDSECGIVTFNVKGIFAQDAASYFNKNGFALRSGNHCAKILLNVIGVSETLRASFYFYNTKEEIDRFVQLVKQTTLDKCVDSIL